MERIFAFLQYMYSVLLHANKPSPERMFVNGTETVFSVADFFRYCKTHNGWRLEASHSTSPYSYISVWEIGFNMPSFYIAACRIIGKRHRPTCGFCFPTVTIYTDDTPDNIRDKVLEIQGYVIKTWSEVIEALADLNRPEVFKKPKLWAWWQGELSNFLSSVHTATYTDSELEPNSHDMAHYSDGWEFVGDRSGYWAHVTEARVRFETK